MQFASFLGTTIAEIALVSLADGGTVFVQYTTPQSGKVAIGLMQDEQNAPLHIGVRYDWRGDKKVVVVNTLKNNQWQAPEKPLGFPFESGYLTTLKIVPSGTDYKLYANGSHFYDFKMRSGGTPDKVKSLVVKTADVPQPGTQVAQVLVSRISNFAITNLHTYSFVLCVGQLNQAIAVIGGATLHQLLLMYCTVQSYLHHCVAITVSRNFN